MTFVLDAYAARSCPLKTANAFTPSLVAPSLDRAAPAWFHDADAIEADVVGRLAASGRSMTDLRDRRGQPAEEHEAATLAAMAAGADVIVGPMLPRDPAAHRSGRPTLLVREAMGRGYHPVHLKMYKVTEPGPTEEPPLVASRLGDPRTAIELPGRRFRFGSRIAVVLQLAHYWRLLEACGHAAAEPWAGVIGLDQLNTSPSGQPATLERVISWLDLAASVLPPDPRLVEFPGEAPPVSGLERYDAEHAFRVSLAEAALAGQETMLTPIVSPECRHCRWQQHCWAQLDADDLSLRISKAPLDVHEVRTLRRLGVSTVAELAGADLDALLVDYLPRVSHRDGGEQRLRRAHRRAQMMQAGIELERQTEGPLDLPRHELEIDIDIETSADDRVYLWGFWVDDPRAPEPFYRAFAAFRELDDDAESALAATAFAWLRDVTAGRDAAVYHYSEYEVLRVRRLADRCPADLAAAVVGLAEERFVDLFEVIRRNFFGANGLGLKVVASAVTGFAWRDESPGGLNSQSWFAEAVHDEDPAVRELARVRVLEYNEDDVRATWHLRRWLREQR